MWRIFFLLVNFFLPPSSSYYYSSCWVLGWSFVGCGESFSLAIPPPSLPPSSYYYYYYCGCWVVGWFFVGWMWRIFFLCFFGVDFFAFHPSLLCSWLLSFWMIFSVSFFRVLFVVCIVRSVVVWASLCFCFCCSSCFLFWASLLCPSSSSFFLVCLNLIFRMCASFQSCVCVRVRACFFFFSC